MAGKQTFKLGDKIKHITKYKTYAQTDF